MAWLNGKHTVYCRYCGTKGHNSRTCPERSPESKAADRVSLRRCRWCNGEGHNSRTCPKRVEDFNAYYKLNAAHRLHFFQEINRIGMTPGALVTINTGELGHGTKLTLDNVPPYRVLMIESVDWDVVFHVPYPTPARSTYSQRRRVKNTMFNRNPIFCKALQERPQDVVDWNYYSETKLTLPAEHEWYQPVVLMPGGQLGENTVPADWFSGISGTDRIKW